MIADQSLRRTLDELASSAPTPGGGSAAAIMGAMGAALVSMVCNVTIGRKDCEGVEADMRQALAEAEALRQRLTQMIEADVQAFGALMAAYKLPRATDEDKLARAAAIQDALKQATDVPLACAEACAQVIDLARRVAPCGNRGVISDAGVASVTAYAALRSAALNVYINAPSIKDAEFVRSRREQLDRLLARCASASGQAYDTVLGRLG
ncbi:MAG TPA: cyclodeaminase/cyclohydrolase family protein [Burkholderiaceae bacterium]|jgi:formiminotetrahydrofolate cyclodeaminase|nr:cyclodeaminase/cyclohydrolase family protein [Burkholderiaceae bacterium]